MADIEDGQDNYRSLNSDNKNNRQSNRKIKPIQYGVNNQGGKNIIKVVQSQDEQQTAGSNAPYLAKNNVMQIVTNPQYSQLQQNVHGKMMSRERNGKVMIAGNNGTRNYPVGTQNVPRQDPLKLVNVYANAQQKRQAAR